MDAGNFYHVYNRGINKQPIFFEEENYFYFLKQFKKYISPHAEVFAYSLLPNHFHFLIRVNEFSLEQKNKTKLSLVEKAFKDFFISYAKSINKRYSRTGALFQYKFKRKEVKEIKHYTWLIYYIHLNPIKAGLCKKFNEWKFSSYLSLISDKPTILSRGELINWFSNKEAFIEFHENNLKEFNSALISDKSLKNYKSL
jgi:REP element-mobilizing transposase RayT